jgi:hypothetical protein
MWYSGMVESPFEASATGRAMLLKMYKFSTDPTTVAFAAQFACEAYKQRATIAQ